MIVPPTPCFYQADLRGDVAAEAVATFSPAAAADVLEALVTSVDMRGDLLASAEMDTALEALGRLTGRPLRAARLLNPLYTPTPRAELEAAIETDLDGNARGIGGFGNPFVSMKILGKDGDETLVRGHVCHHPFHLPTMAELLASETPLLS